MKKDSKGKVLLIIESFNIGGAERQALNLTCGLQKIGYEVTLAAFDYTGMLLSECKKLDIKTEKLPGSFSDSSFKYSQSRLKLLYSLFPLWLKIMQLSPRIIIPFTAPCNMSVNLISPFLLRTRTFWNQRDLGLGLSSNQKNLLIKALSRSSSIVSNSLEGANFLNGLFPNKGLNVTIINNGIQVKQALNTPEEWRKVLGIQDNKIALMLANIHAAKDHETAVRAWSIVVNAFSTPPVLVFAGRYNEDDPLYKFICKLVLDLNLRENIKFIGFSEDVAGLLSLSDISIFSSNTEGLPNAVIEPMFYNVPIVATDLPGVREALGHDYKYISKHKDYESLASDCIELLKNDSKRLSAVNQNKKRATQIFSLEAMINSYVKLIENNA